MTVQIDISDLEDKVLNSLNSILLITYGNNIYKDVEKEIRRIVTILEKEHLITDLVISL
jgi:hypothetical protein